MYYYCDYDYYGSSNNSIDTNMDVVNDVSGDECLTVCALFFRSLFLSSYWEAAAAAADRHIN